MLKAHAEVYPPPKWTLDRLHLLVENLLARIEPLEVKVNLWLPGD